MNRKVVVVTGANRGIGRAVVQLLNEKGYYIVLTSRTLAKAKKAKDSLLHNNNILPMELDVSDIGSIEIFSQDVFNNFETVDILINNAGINYDTHNKAVDISMKEVKETLETNLFGAWRLSQLFIPSMKKHNFGRIVNVSSESGAISGMNSGTPAYSISKAAMNVMTIKLAKELLSYNIKVNSVCPGWVKTDMGGINAPRSVEQGAKSIVWAAELSDDGPSGGFFRDGKPIPF